MRFCVMLSYARASQIEAQLQAEVKELMALAEAADKADVPDGMSVPEELARREKQLERIAEAKAAIEARAKERFARAQAEHEAKLKAREDKAKKKGRKPGGKPPLPPTAGPGPKDQVNLTDEDSRIMPVAGGSFDQACNAQAAVAAGSMLVVCRDVVQAPNDKQQIEPVPDQLTGRPEALGKAETLLADSGYFSQANVEACAETEITPLIAPGRERHNRSWKAHFAAAPPEPDDPTPVQAMQYRLATPEGRQALCAAQADARARVRNHQVGHGLSTIPPARPPTGEGRVEPGHNGLEHEANVRPQPALRARHPFQHCSASATKHRTASSNDHAHVIFTAISLFMQSRSIEPDRLLAPPQCRWRAALETPWPARRLISPCRTTIRSLSRPQPARWDSSASDSTRARVSCMPHPRAGAGDKRHLARHQIRRVAPCFLFAHVLSLSFSAVRRK